MRTVERTILRDAATIGVAAAVIGVSFGVLAVGRGASVTQTWAMSLAVFAGGSQFVLIGGIGSGIAAAVVAGLLLNVRHVAFGISVAPFLRGPWWRRALASQIVVDESTGYSLTQPDLRRSRQGFFAVGLMLFAAWNAGTAVGALAGEAIDYRAFGIDAAFPALLLAMLAGQLTNRAARIAAVAGAAIAVAATPVVPRGAPMLLAAAGGFIALAFAREEAEE